MHTHFSRTTVFVILLVLVGSTLPAQTVINHIRLGNVVEDATYITSGPYAKQFVYIDGYNVMGVTNGGKNTSAKPQKLFDTTKLSPFPLAARGVSYIPEKQQFVFTNNVDPYNIYFADVHGNPTGTLAIQWPDTMPFIPTNVEAIRWIGSKDSLFPGKYLVVINDNAGGEPVRDASGRIAVIDQFGVVERFITPSTLPDYITGLAYLPPNRLIFGLANYDTISSMDLDGNVINTISSGTFDVEALAFVDGNTLLSLAHGTGKVIAYDSNLQRVPSRDRNYAYGFGLDLLHGIAWDNDRFSLVSWAQDEKGPALTYGLYSFDPFGIGVSTLNDFGIDPPTYSSSGTTYLTNEHLIAISHAVPSNGLWLFNNSGLQVQERDTNAVLRAPITYIGPFNQVAGRQGPTIAIFNATTGELVRNIELSGLSTAMMTGLAYFNPQHPSGGEFLVFFNSTPTAYVLDFDGNVLTTFDTVLKLGIHAPGAVTAVPIGNFCGLFATYDGGPNQIVEFTMPCQ